MSEKFQKPSADQEVRTLSDEELDDTGAGGQVTPGGGFCDTYMGLPAPGGQPGQPGGAGNMAVAVGCAVEHAAGA